MLGFDAMEVAGDPGRPALLDALALPPPGPTALLGRDDVAFKDPLGWPQLLGDRRG